MKNAAFQFFVVNCSLLAPTPETLFAQGNLNPPDVPAPTMKTLDEVRPHIPIHPTDLPKTIDTPGSYFLTGNVSAGGNGISIATNNVTIDLMGFALMGGTGAGISAASEIRNVTVRNGTISGWSDAGLELFDTTGVLVSEIHASGNGSHGIQIGGTGSVVDSTAISNASIGVRASVGSTVRGCTVEGNGSHGVSVSSGCSITGSTAKDNTLTGFSASSGSVLTGLAAYSNDGTGISVVRGTVINCSAHINGTDGIRAQGGRIEGSTAFLNTGNGIRATGETSVIGNDSYDNGNNGDGAGIHVRFSGSRIEGNNVVGNDRGIDVDEGGNVIIRNSASANLGGSNYVIVAGNTVGPISTGLVPTNHPWANFEF
jgi:parallel beta-helix repeat protein